MPSEHLCEVQIGLQGQLVMPPPYWRPCVGTQETPCWRDLARLDGHRLILEQRSGIMQRVQSRFASIPQEVNLADELISERREEAMREAIS